MARITRTGGVFASFGPYGWWMSVHTLFPELLTAHRAILNLVTSLEVESDREVSKELREELLVRLAAHMAAEDQVVVPTLQKHVRDEDNRVMLHESELDHDEMWSLAVRILLAEPASLDCKAAARALNKIMVPHMEEEENETYFLARQVLSYSRFVALTRRVTERQEVLMEHARELCASSADDLGSLYPTLKRPRDGGLEAGG